LNALGDAYRNSGNYSDAVAQYDESLAIDKTQTAVIVRKVEALRFDGKRVPALETALQGLAPPASPEQKEIHVAAQELIRSFQFQDLDDSLTLLKNAFDSGASVTDEYALALLMKGYAGGADPRPWLQQARSLNPADPNIQVEINCELATWYLNRRDPNNAEAFLKRAEEISKSTTLAPEIQAWILRLRAVSLMDAEKFRESYDDAQSAVRLTSSASEKFVLTEVAYYWARHLESDGSGTEKGESAKEERNEAATRLYREVISITSLLVDARYTAADWYFLEANHFLNQDKETVQRFKRIVKDNPNDDSAQRTLMYVCTEYLFDRDCAVSAAVQYMQSQGRAGPQDIGTLLDCVEIAILNGADKNATEWLAIAAERSGTPPSRAAIIHLYQSWLDLLHNDRAGARQAFAAWSKDLVVFRDARDNLDWTFNGAKHALKASNFADSHKTLLLRMIRCLEDPNLPPPEFSD
jgi:tetratricopeptide (TPR) repeat protein